MRCCYCYCCCLFIVYTLCSSCIFVSVSAVVAVSVSVSVKCVHKIHTANCQSRLKIEEGERKKYFDDELINSATQCYHSLSLPPLSLSLTLLVFHSFLRVNIKKARKTRSASPGKAKGAGRVL